MHSSIKIRPAPSGKFYIMWFEHPICDAAGRLRYFDDDEKAQEFMAKTDAAELLGSIAA